jgi:hypothetical protein
MFILFLNMYQKYYKHYNIYVRYLHAHPLPTNVQTIYLFYDLLFKESQVQLLPFEPRQTQTTKHETLFLNLDVWFHMDKLLNKIKMSNFNSSFPSLSLSLYLFTITIVYY